MLLNSRTAFPIATVLALTQSCGSELRSTDSVGPSNPVNLTGGKLIVEPQELTQWSKEFDVTVIDARTPEEYAKGHIANAVSLHHRATYDADDLEMMAPLQVIEDLFSECGVCLDQPVVIYDNRDFRDACRLFWILEVHGHEQVVLLNGGYDGWVEHGGAVSMEPTQPARSRFFANLQPQRLASKRRVQESMFAPGVVIIDSRPRADFMGEVSVGPRAGHIPSAQHLDFAENLSPETSTCRIRDVDELRELYERLPNNSEYISYCNTGTHASVSYFALRLLNRDVAMYDGSWLEWSSDPSLPIDNPAAEKR